VPVSIAVVISGAFAGMWGARFLNPGVVGLLYMTEVSVGAATAALWANEPFGWREIAGIALITCAGLLDSVWDLVASRRLKAKRA
jgi:drug/metabolite transporter (DMT)-like permease